VRTALGVYVLGAIEPAGRSEVEAHLAACPACRDELAALAGLPALLGRVSEPQIEHVAGPPSELLDSLLARAAAQRQAEQAEQAEREQAERDQAEREQAQRDQAQRELSELRERRELRSRRRRPPVAVAAAVVLLAGMLLGGLLSGALTGGGLLGGGGGAPPRGAATPGPATPRPLAPVTDEVVRTDPQTHVRARIWLDEQEWGTALTVRMDGAPPGVSCHLYAVAKNGHRDVAAGWRIESEGYGDFFGSTMIARDQLTSLEVVTTDGRTLVTVPVGV
jgi:hypothetical protein